MMKRGIAVIIGIGIIASSLGLATSAAPDHANAIAHGHLVSNFPEPFVTKRSTPILVSRYFIRLALPTYSMVAVDRPAPHMPAVRSAKSGRADVSVVIPTHRTMALHRELPSPSALALGPDYTFWANAKRLRTCESGNNYAEKANALYRGAYQIGYAEWRDIGFSGDPANAPAAQQDLGALRLWRARGWQPWYSSSKCSGLR